MQRCIPSKSNIDTQNDGFLDVSPFKHGITWLFWVSMLDFRGVYICFLERGRYAFFAWKRETETDMKSPCQPLFWRLDPWTPSVGFKEIRRL